MPLTSGATFAGYTIVSALGRGRTGDLYLVDSAASPRRLALKVLSDEVSADPDFRHRFLREAQLATTLYHRNILEMHDCGQFDGRLWIATDYIDGTNAARLIADEFPSGMPIGQALAIVTAIADALDYAHHRGLVHRGVEPGRILLPEADPGGRRILLAGFGLGRDPGGLGSTAVAGLTPDAAAYAAPEQLTGASVDGRADQYALAAITFTLLTGDPPFAGNNPIAVIGQHLTAARPILSERRADLRPLDAVLRTALAIDPAGRFGSCRTFTGALAGQVSAPAGNLSPEAALAVAGSERPPDATPTVVSRRRLRMITGAAALAALLLVFAIVAVTVGHQRDNRTASPVSPEVPPGIPTPTTAPVSPAPAAPPPLDGTYRIDTHRSRQTYNGAVSPQPPDVVTWWAFRSVCSRTECLAAAVMLDDSRRAPAPDGAALRWETADGHWQSRPQTLLFPCVDQAGQTGEQTITQAVVLRPSDDRWLDGEMTIDVTSDECGQRGAVIRVPTVAERVDEVPPGVDVPDPTAPATTTPAITTPTR